MFTGHASYACGFPKQTEVVCGCGRLDESRTRRRFSVRVIQPGQLPIEQRWDESDRRDVRGAESKS